MANQPHQFTTAVGRLIGGSVHTPRTTDYDGKPLLVKTGPNAGQPRVDYNFGVAIPKTPGVTHWAYEPWGGAIYALAQAAFPGGEWQRRDFAWKITDGDSTELNKRNKRPCDQEGYPGHWVIWFSGSNPPRTYNADGSQQIPADSIETGYYVQVFGNVRDNKPSQSPGLYFNHSMVALSAYGERIISGPDVTAAGFGQGVQLPAGASATPPATFTPPALPGAALPPMGGPSVPPPLPGGSAPMPAAPAPAAPALPPSAVTPNPNMLQVPGMAPAAPLPPVHQMTAKANGMPYDDWIKSGWTDTLLIQHGYMTA